MKIILKETRHFYVKYAHSKLLKYSFMIASIPYIVKVSLIYANDTRKSTDSIQKIHEYRVFAKIQFPKG